MANKSEFLSRGLHKIRTQLAEAQASKKAGEQHEKTEIIRPPQQAAQHNNAPSKEPGKEHGKIPSPRCEELDRARFSLSEKLSNALAILPDGIGKHETRLQELNAARDSFNEMLAKLQALEEISSSKA